MLKDREGSQNLFCCVNQSHIQRGSTQKKKIDFFNKGEGEGVHFFEKAHLQRVFFSFAL